MTKRNINQSVKTANEKDSKHRNSAERHFTDQQRKKQEAEKNNVGGF